jgi:acetyl esterase/lipase
MRTWFITGLTLLLALASGCTRFDILNGMIPSSGYDRTTGLSYGPLPRQKLDVYRPKGQTASAPVVVFFYGGSWQAGERGNYKFVAEALTEKGFVAIVPDYRLFPAASFPAFVEDSAAAVAWAHGHAAEFGGDPSRLFVMGHSAGAYNAVMLGVDGTYLARFGLGREVIRGIISLAGPFDILPIHSKKYLRLFGSPANDPWLEPYRFVDGKEPPMLLLHGLEDIVIKAEESEQLAFALRNHGDRAELVEYGHMGHAELILALARGFRWLGPVLGDVERFIRSFG